MRDGALLESIAAATRRDAAVAALRRAFEAAGLDTPALDARLLVAAALDVTAAALLTTPDTPLGAAGAEQVAAFGRRRLAREPVARILGEAAFWGLPICLSPATLVPRPDTETLVEFALALRPDREAPLRILDLGTGSGCILLALLHERPRAHGIGIDRSPEALATAQANTRRNGLTGRAAFAASDWDAALVGPFDLVVSNPPYIPDGAVAGLDPEVAGHDPVAALAGGPDGLDAPRRVIAAAGRLLAPDGIALVEFGHDQAEPIGALARSAGFGATRFARDLGGHVRCVALAHEAGALALPGQSSM